MCLRSPTFVSACNSVRFCVVSFQDHGVEYKGDNSPLTLADTESNHIICEGLQRINPHIPIISEETRAMAYDIRKVSKALEDNLNTSDVVNQLPSGHP